MDYDDLDDYGKALSDAYHAADASGDHTGKAVLGGLFGAHTDVGDAGPPPPKPPVHTE